MSFLGFGTPFILIALAVLPVIWFLLRITPPKPQYEPFPPLKILSQLVKDDKTASKTPWWLVLLRLLIAGLVIIALAQPLANPHQLLPAGGNALIVMMDNSFAAWPNWQNHKQAAQKLVREAANRDMPVYVIATIEEENAPIGPYSAREAIDIINKISVFPLAVNRLEAFRRLEEIPRMGKYYQLAYINDGLAGDGDETALEILSNLDDYPILWYQGKAAGLAGLNSMENGAEMMRVGGVRVADDISVRYNVGAYDVRGRRLAEAEMVFATGASEAQAEFVLPVEMRNDISLLKLESEATAAAIWLTSSSDQRRRIAMLSAPMEGLVQPLLSPLYYPMQAISPFGDLIYVNKTALSANIDILLDANPALMVMGDEFMAPGSNQQRLSHWIEAGGTLLRFAGPRLAASSGQDAFLPVRLRRGERTMGGAMSWATPQKIAGLDRNSPLSGLEIPDDVTITRQILAEPEVGLFDKSWITLEDGTPLVTAQRRGQGRIVLVHTTASPDWSNLALSGFFVDMLQRLVMSSKAPSVNASVSPMQKNDGRMHPLSTLPPWRILSVDGQLQTPPTSVRPLQMQSVENRHIRASLQHFPGLYGVQEENVALNLLNMDSRFRMLEPPAGLGLVYRHHTDRDNLPLGGFLWAAALVLFTLDCLIMVLQQKNWQLKQLWQPDRRMGQSFFASSLLIMPVCLMEDGRVMAQTQSPEQILVERAAKTRLAYVKTGNHHLDALSQSGLEELSLFISSRTTIELGEVIGVDPEFDELSFYPLLYWPMDGDSPLPGNAAVARVDIYMRQGGSVLFDTRDELVSGLDRDNAPTPATAHLRAILGQLDIPPLEPAPPEHVVARSFYIMPDFPGRYRGSPLWLEALPPEVRGVAGKTRARSVPVIRSGDGVSPILVTANDFIGAWAQNDSYDWFYPTVSGDPSQRLWAFRGGLNIVVYLLSGNYKADQVHAPELLRRLGE